MLNRIKTFMKNETVLVISTVIAIITAFFVPPDKEYTGYVDFRILCLLFCLMAIVAAFKAAGVFNYLTYKLLNRVRNGKLLAVILVMLPFFCSMLVTNDVALIIFIPFTVSLLLKSGNKKSIIPITVIQTVAANLGSMATPIGNPQNLFLFSEYNLTISDFLNVSLPLTAISFLALTLSSLCLLPSKMELFAITEERISNKRKLIYFSLLFILAILTVFRVLPYQLTTVITAVSVLMLNKSLFKEIDFMLLLTFVCFFVISENLGRLEIVREFLQMLLEKSALLTSVGASQVISNVPSAVLLSSFTDNWQELLAGVNIGGLGTPVASLASLITLKFYFKSPDATPLRFIAVFSVVNLIGLIILLGFELIS